MTHATFCSVLSIAENPQQDKKNLLCLWEADGKLQRVLSFQYVSLISRKLSSAVTVLCWFSAPFRIPHATTGPTDWLWPNSVLLTSPSCLCCSKVTDTRLQSISCECHELIADMFSRCCLRPDMTFINEGNPNYVDKLVNFEKLVRLKSLQHYSAWSLSSKISSSEWDGLKCSLFLPFAQRMIAKTVKIVRGCRSQPYSKWSSWARHASRLTVLAKDMPWFWLWMTRVGYIM